jgi:hypothetical protein
MDSITLIMFAFACWLAFYLIARNNHPRLRLTGAGLLGNSIFCFLSGLDFVLFSGPIARFLGLSSSTLLLVLGIILVAYALVVYSQSRAQPLNLAFARYVIILDVLWVIGSAVLVFTNLVAFTIAGKWAIAIIADIVLVFAIVQFVGLRRITNS